jgi:predicted glycoside hydrolase/deacetylase ChbG (UPF0249 family)
VSGLLIINADDLGGRRPATDAALEAHAAGGITSATAMVHMPDSARAAELALEQELPVGLHLNLTQAFEADDVPPGVRERQRRVVAHFTPLSRARRLMPVAAPALRQAVRDTIADQLAAFRELYGGEPTHLDSHNHAHTALVVLRELPTELPLRLTRTRRGSLLRRRFATTDEFHPIHHVAAELGGTGAAPLAARARTRTIEVMTHPAEAGELDVLRGDAWQAALAEAPLGSYADLARRRAALPV